MLLAYSPAADHALARHGERVIFLRSTIGALEGDTNIGWMHVAPFGEWRGHPSGPFAFTRETCSEIKLNFERIANDSPVVIGHPGTDTPAEGWILGYDVRDDGLWARVKWHPLTAQAIREERWKYCSAEVVFRAIDRKSGLEGGAEIRKVGLTNEPFLDGQTPLSLSRSAANASARRLSNMDPEKMIAGVAKALGLDPGTSKEKVVSMLEAIYSFLGAMSGDAAAEVAEKAATDAELSRKVVETAKLVRKLSVNLADAPADESMAAADAAANAILTKLLEATKMDEAAVLAAVTANIDAIAQILAGQPASGTPTESDAASLSRNDAAVVLKATQDRVKALELTNKSMAAQLSAIADEKLKGRVDEAIKLGHITEDARDTYMQLGRTNQVAFDRLLLDASQRPVVPTHKLTKTGGGVDGAPVPTTPAEKALIAEYVKLGASEQTQRIALDLHRSTKGK